MSEISMYEAQKKKMQGLCDEHDLVYRFEKDRYPIIFTIKPVQGMDAQISMLENVEAVSYTHLDVYKRQYRDSARTIARTRTRAREVSVLSLIHI